MFDVRIILVSHFIKSIYSCVSGLITHFDVSQTRKTFLKLAIFKYTLISIVLGLTFHLIRKKQNIHTPVTFILIPVSPDVVVPPCVPPRLTLLPPPLQAQLAVDVYVFWRQTAVHGRESFSRVF